MIPNTKLITALREVAEEIENGGYNWEWDVPSKCNCGLLVQKLLNLSEKDVREFRIGWWTSAARAYFSGACTYIEPIQHYSLLFESLSALGLEFSDYTEIEFVGKLGTERTRIVTYFRDKADELENILNTSNSVSFIIPTLTKQTQQTTVPVSCSSL